jgi:hypothetical protein
MIPTQFIVDKVRTLLATDTGSLAAVAAMKVRLAQNAFVPAPSRVLADFTIATFGGYADLLAGIGNAQQFNDPATGGRVAQLLEPAGGWHWQATGAALPQTIYGYYVVDNAGVQVLGCALFTTPVVLTANGDAIDVANIRITFPPNVLF